MDAPIRNHLGLTLEHGFRFEALRVDPVTGEVVGPGGRQKLDPKVMDVLVLLAARAGQVLSRDELNEQLWQGTVVTDDALTRCISELRRQLSLAGGNERYRTLLETLPKRGYRLKGTIAPLEPEQPAPSPRTMRNWRAAAAGATVLALILFAALRSEDRAAPPAAAANSIAVLPFVDMSEAQDQRYFADGIAEEILNRLAKSGALRVISRTSSFSFRGDDLDIPAIAAKLDVSHVLEGSVRRAGDKVRITAQLISAADNSHLWSHTYERDVGELFAVQDQIAGAVATALNFTLAPRRNRGGMTSSAEAYEKYLRGRFLYDRRAPGDVERSAQYFEEAVALDPGFAKAWAAMSGAYGLLVNIGAMPAEAGLAKQRDAALRAVQLDPGSAEAESRLSRYYFDVNDHRRGREHAQRAAELDPENVLVLGALAGIATWNDDAETALAIYRKAAARDPLSTTQRQNLAIGLMHAGRLDEAIVELRKVQELNPAIFAEFEMNIAQLHALRGRPGDAYASIQRLPDGAPRDAAVALLFEEPARRQEAEAALARLVERSARVPDATLAEVYAFRGMHDEAVASLERAWQALRDDPGIAPDDAFDFQIDLRTSPLLRRLRGDPRFRALIMQEFSLTAKSSLDAQAAAD